MKTSTTASHQLLATILIAVSLAVASCNEVPPATAEAPQTLSEAERIAESVLEAMGGREAWDSTRYITWKFFGSRQHYWDKFTGDIRIEMPESQRGPETLVLMNLNSREGRVWRGGEELLGDDLAEALEGGWSAWVNDSYWMFMPYKLRDPGVNLTYVGEDLMEDDREADVLQLTFESVGVTPQNKYLVYVAKDSGLVEQWSYFPTRDAVEPGFTRPWAGWQRFGNLHLATSKGRGADWDIQVPDTLPAELFTDPDYR